MLIKIYLYICNVFLLVLKDLLGHANLWKNRKLLIFVYVIAVIILHAYVKVSGNKFGITSLTMYKDTFHWVLIYDISRSTFES